MKKLACMMLSVILYSGITAAQDTLSYNKSWTTATIIGSFSKHSSFKYYIEPQLRLIATSTVFSQVYLLGGLGYQFNEDVMFFIGHGGIASKTSRTNILFFENRLWQQLHWRLVNTPNWNVNSRTRLEERKLTNFAPVAFRFRERMWLRVPLKKWEGYSFSCFDEIFFNLNHPRWASPYTLEQNRAFIGLAYQLAPSTLLDVGYLNQYFHSNINQLNHILLISFTVNL